MPKVSETCSTKCNFSLQTRRRFLKVGGLTALGLLLRGEKAFASTQSPIVAVNGRDKGLSLILIVLQGGLSHFDSFDPREPNVVSNIRGPFRRIETSATKSGGVYVTEVLPMVAEHMNKILVVRNLYHNDGNHSTAACLLLTGSPEKIVSNDPYSDAKSNSPFVTLSEHLTKIGSSNIGYVVFHHSEGRVQYTPDMDEVEEIDETELLNNKPFVFPPDKKPHGGLQSGHVETLYIPYDFTKKDHTLPIVDLSTRQQYRERRHLLDELNKLGKTIEGKSVERSLAVDKKVDSFLDGSFQEAMDLNKEPDEIRERYGNNPFGRELLMARRMVQAGARVVAANDGDYDQHQDIKPNLERLLGRFDRAYTALLEDIERLNLPIIVAVVTEFGRTPYITGTNGREHWPNSFSMLLSGEGVEGGRFIGEVNNHGLIKGDALNAAFLGETLLRKIGFARYATRNGFLTNELMPYLPI